MVALLDPCPNCHGAGSWLYLKEGETTPDLVPCTLCATTGYVECATCLGSGEYGVMVDDEWAFDGFCTCTAGRALAKQHCQVQRVMATSVPYYEEAFT